MNKIKKLKFKRLIETHLKNKLLNEEAFNTYKNKGLGEVSVVNPDDYQLIRKTEMLDRVGSNAKNTNGTSWVNSNIEPANNAYYIVKNDPDTKLSEMVDNNEEVGGTGEYLAGETACLTSLFDATAYQNLNAKLSQFGFSAITNLGGLGEDSFIGVDVFLSKNGQSFLNTPISNGIVDFGEAGTFASVKASNRGSLTSGLSKTKPPNLSESAQEDVIYLILYLWLKHNIVDNQAGDIHAALFPETIDVKRYDQLVKGFTGIQDAENKLARQMAGSNVESEINIPRQSEGSSLTGVRDKVREYMTKLGINEVKLAIDAINISAIQTGTIVDYLQGNYRDHKYLVLCASKGSSPSSNPKLVRTPGSNPTTPDSFTYSDATALDDKKYDYAYAMLSSNKYEFNPDDPSSYIAVYDPPDASGRPKRDAVYRAGDISGVVSGVIQYERGRDAYNDDHYAFLQNFHMTFNAAFGNARGGTSGVSPRTESSIVNFLTTQLAIVNILLAEIEEDRIAINAQKDEMIETYSQEADVYNKERDEFIEELFDGEPGDAIPPVSIHPGSGDDIENIKLKSVGDIDVNDPSYAHSPQQYTDDYSTYISTESHEAEFSRRVNKAFSDREQKINDFKAKIERHKRRIETIQTTITGFGPAPIHQNVLYAFLNAFFVGGLKSLKDASTSVVQTTGSGNTSRRADKPQTDVKRIMSAVLSTIIDDPGTSPISGLNLRDLLTQMRANISALETSIEGLTGLAPDPQGEYSYAGADLLIQLYMSIHFKRKEPTTANLLTAGNGYRDNMISLVNVLKMQYNQMLLTAVILELNSTGAGEGITFNDLLSTRGGTLSLLYEAIEREYGTIPLEKILGAFMSLFKINTALIEYGLSYVQLINDLSKIVKKANKFDNVLNDIYNDEKYFNLEKPTYKNLNTQRNISNVDFIERENLQEVISRHLKKLIKGKRK